MGGYHTAFISLVEVHNLDRMIFFPDGIRLRGKSYDVFGRLLVRLRVGWDVIAEKEGTWRVQTRPSPLFAQPLASDESLVTTMLI